MAENVGSVESEFGSVTSSQISFLKNCPFADPLKGAKETDSDTTEVLVTPMSPPVARTPILSSLSTTPIGLDSVNDEEVFRTPPENASLSSSSAAESEPRARVSKLKSKSPPPVSAASPSLAVRNLRVLETNRIADPEEPVTDVTPLTSPPTVPGGGGSKSKSKSPSPVSASRPPSAESVRVLEMNRLSDPEERVTEVRTLTSPPSPAAGNVRVPGNNSDSESPSPPTVATGDVRVPAKRSGGFDSPSPGKHSDLDSSPPSETEGIEVTESGDGCEIEIPFKEVIEALLRNSGENLEERDERVSYVDILKQFGLKFP